MSSLPATIVSRPTWPPCHSPQSPPVVRTYPGPALFCLANKGSFHCSWGGTPPPHSGSSSEAGTGLANRRHSLRICGLRERGPTAWLEAWTRLGSWCSGIHHAGSSPGSAPGKYLELCIFIALFPKTHGRCGCLSGAGGVLRVLPWDWGGGSNEGSEAGLLCPQTLRPP